LTIDYFSAPSEANSSVHPASTGDIPHTQYEQRTPCNGDFLKICQTFHMAVRIIYNE